MHRAELESLQAGGTFEGDAESIRSLAAADDMQTSSSDPTMTNQARFQQGPLQQGLHLDACFGKVIRTVNPGDSFGELALLHKHARRTASVITCSSEPSGSAGAVSHDIGAVSLIRISRKDYDLTVSKLAPFI